MNKKEFLKQVKERIQEFLTPEYSNLEVIVRRFDGKGGKRYGLALQNEESKIVPVLDLEDAFQAVKEGMDINDALKAIAGIYMQISEEEKQVSMVEVTKEDFEQRLHMVVINFKNNKTTLAKAPYLKINDLAVIPMYSMPDGGSAAMRLEDAEDVFGSGDLLLAKAMINHKNLFPPILIPLRNDSSASEEMIALDNREELSSKADFYILTNKERQYGAAAIADKDILSMISSKMGDNFYVLPCNIHELAVVPASNGHTMGEMKEQMEIYHKKCPKGTALSDNIYFYDADRNVVKMYDGRLREEKVQSRSDSEIR